MKDLKIFTKNIEQEAVEQINLLLEQEPFKDCKIRIMPDVHAGKGCVIGFTADLGEKVIPNIVGVDIGCGMLCVELGNIELNLEKLDKIINEFIPAGRNIREQKLIDFEKINDLYCLRELKETKKFNRAIGTLGGGNHFIEIDVDEDNNKYLVEPIYDIKLLSKYSDNEIDSAIDKNIILEHSIISLEQTILKVVYDFLKGIHNTQYFLEMPIEIFERQKYSKILSEIFKIECIKKNVVVVLKHDDIVENKDTIASLKRQNYVLALNHIDILKVNEQSFTNFDYLFVNQQFLETHEGYQEIWRAQGINFIIS